MPPVAQVGDQPSFTLKTGKTGGGTAGTQGLTPDERQQILEQLERILQCPIFRSSKRYPALLKYIVLQKLNGRDELLKERILGIEVFGRSTDYDTNVDHVVRTAAGEVRKRLALYYVEQGQADPVRIEVPPGSYVPQFRWTVAERFEKPAVIPGKPDVASQPSWARTAIVASVAVIVLLGSILASGHLTGILQGESMLDKFWDPVFRTSSPVVLCVGLRNTPVSGSENAASAAATAEGPSVMTDPLMSRVAMADLLSLSRISSYAGERHAPFRVMNPAVTSFGDLRSAPTVLIGVGNNDWARQVASSLRFTYFMSESGVRPIAIRDRQNPKRADWQLLDVRAAHYKDYAIVSRLVDPRIEQVVVLVGGLGPHGTEAAGEFVTSPEHMKKMKSYAPSGWEKKNVQVVLSTEVVKGSSGPPKIEAAWFW